MARIPGTIQVHPLVLAIFSSFDMTQHEKVWPFCFETQLYDTDSYLRTKVSSTVRSTMKLFHRMIIALIQGTKQNMTNDKQKAGKLLSCNNTFVPTKYV